MVLIYIENKQMLTKTISYFEQASISYTTDLNCDYDSILCAEVNNKILGFVNENYEKKKDIYFITYLEEKKIITNNKLKNKSSRIYNQKLFSILKKCDNVIVSLPSIKQIINNKISNEITVVEKEIPIINISKYNKDIYDKYNISKRKKKIIVIDLDYKNIESMIELASTYNKYNFIYIGYKPDYLLTEKNKDYLYHMPKNVTTIKYIDLNIFSDLCKLSHIVINFEDINLDLDYLYTIILFKKQLLQKDNLLYEDYLINSKNSYIFKDKNELFLKLKKLIDERVANLTDEAYDLIRENTSKEIAIKLNNCFK